MAHAIEGGKCKVWEKWPSGQPQAGGSEYQTANALYQKDCTAIPSDQDANAVVGTAFGSKFSPQQQAAIDQHQRDAEARKNSPHCKELDAKRDELTKQMLIPQNQ